MTNSEIIDEMEKLLTEWSKPWYIAKRSGTFARDVNEGYRRCADLLLGRLQRMCSQRSDDTEKEITILRAKVAQLESTIVLMEYEAMGKDL